MTRNIIGSGVLAILALLAGPQLFLVAETQAESLQAMIVCFIGLGFAILFACLLAERMDHPHGRSR